MTIPTVDSTRLADVAEQIRTEIGAVVGAVVALLGPGFAHVETQIPGASILWAEQLLGDDDKLAGQTVIDLMNVRWPNGDEPPVEWWTTPLGQAVAASVGHPTSDVVTYAVAGAILGCSRQNVQKLVDADKFKRGPDGHGVTRESVRARLNARRTG